MNLNPRRDSVKPASERRPRNLADLAEVPRWVAWREEVHVRKDGTKFKTKIPYDPNRSGQARIPTDPGTWGTRAQAERRWRELDEGKPGGVGIVLGDLGNGYHLFGSDLDHCIESKSKDDIRLEAIADEIVERFDTYGEISPSGKGLKQLFLVTTEDLPAVQQLLGYQDDKPSTRKTFTAGKHHEIAVDRARFYAVTNDRVERKKFRVVAVEDMRWLIEDVGPRFVHKFRPPGEERASATRVHDQSGSGFGWRFFCDCKARGWTFDQAWEAIFRDPEKAGEWTNSDTRLSEIKRTWDRAPAIRFDDVHPKLRGFGPATTAKELETMIFKPMKYVVPDWFVEGLSLFAGKPKARKSFFMLQVGNAVSRGLHLFGAIKCKPGDVLYCALEDASLRRVQDRLRKMQIEEWSPHLHLYTQMPRLDEGGLELIREWVRSVRRPRLVIIDTFKRVRPLSTGRDSQYGDDYDSLKDLQALAHECGIAVVVVHHVRKATADDIFDTISGTLGLSAVADSILVLARDQSGTMVFHAQGRDIEEFEKAALFNRETFRWKMLGNADEVRRSRERTQVTKAMQVIGAPASPAEIAREAEASVTNVTKLLARMARDGQIRRLTHGRYSLEGA